MPSAVRASEIVHEHAVSKYIGAMSVLWVAVPDAPSAGSARAVIERGAIGLLSFARRSADCSSLSWLGRHSPHPAIRESGLWNPNYVSGATEPGFLTYLEHHVEAMAKNT